MPIFLHMFFASSMDFFVSSLSNNSRVTPVSYTHLAGIEVHEQKIYASAKPDMNYISGSDKRCLDAAITKYKDTDPVSYTHLSFSVGNAIKNGIPVAIIGETNAGKSTLLNALLNEEKAIVSDIHGTTRDVI